MNQKEKARSYERYVQWQENKIRYGSECIAYTLAFCVGVLFVLKNISTFLLVLGIVLIAGSVILAFRIYKKWNDMRAARIELISMLKASGAKNINIDPKTKQISFVLDTDNKEANLEMWKEKMHERGFKLSVLQADDSISAMCNGNGEKFMSSTTEKGYINRNNQRNNGKTSEPGTDNNQWFYEMECLECGEKYKANGTDIFQRKCPKCQGGKP